MQASSEVGLRELKKSQTRRRLTAAARELVLARGLDAVTVEQICGRAGVSVRTFFNYFESKEQAALGEAAPLATSAARAEFVAGGPSGDTLTDLLVLLDPTVRLEREGRDALLTAVRLAEQEPRLLAVLLARAVVDERDAAALLAERRGLPDADLGCAALAATAGALLRTALMAWLHADDSSSLRTWLEAAHAAIRPDLPTPPAQPAR